MSHSRVIIILKLDCIAVNFPSVADSVDILKAKVIATDEYILANDTEQNVGFHEVLESVQAFSSDVCDNGLGTLTETQLGEALNNYSGQLL